MRVRATQSSAGTAASASSSSGIQHPSHHGAETSAASKYASIVGIGRPFFSGLTGSSKGRTKVSVARLVLVVIVCAAAGGLLMELVLSIRRRSSGEQQAPGSALLRGAPSDPEPPPLPPPPIHPSLDFSEDDVDLPPLPPLIDRQQRSQVPQLEIFVERLRTFLKPFTNQYTSSGQRARVEPLAVDADVCVPMWSSPRVGRVLEGCGGTNEAACESFSDLAEAKLRCLSMPSNECAGVTTKDGVTYEIRPRVPKGRMDNIADLTSPVRSWLKVPDPCLQRTTTAFASPAAVYEAFATAVDAALEDQHLSLTSRLGPPREDKSIFVSIASYRDKTCGDTLKRAFERATRPDLISAGIVQQNCVGKSCYTGTGWGNTRRWVKQKGSDPDCAFDFCASELGRPHCEAGRVRILRLDEIDSYGPFFSRFLNSKLWRGENYYLQIDAHTDFRSGWDESLVAQMVATPSYPFSVISNYPPGGTPAAKYDWAAATGDVKLPEEGYPPEALCSCTFETAGESRSTVRLGQTSRKFRTSGLSSWIASKVSGGENPLSIPRRSCFVAAGFFVAHGSIVDVVGFDPFLPYLFMGEELALSLRFYTYGYNIYAPSANYLRHEYVRKEAPKFWESIGQVYTNQGLHNGLGDLIVQRVQYLSKFPEADAPEKVEPSSLMLRAREFGVGDRRTVEEFERITELDVAKKTQRTPQWCREGENPPGNGGL